MTEKPDLTALPHAELVQRAIRANGIQYRALDELARRVRAKPSEWTIGDWHPPFSRPPTPHEIELALLCQSQRVNETDGTFSSFQNARIWELEGLPDVDQGMVTEYMNRLVAEQRKAEVVHPGQQPSRADT